MAVSTLAIIPARLGATRLPRKPLRLLAGVPLVIRVWQRVTALDVADRCVDRHRQRRSRSRSRSRPAPSACSRAPIIPPAPTASPRSSSHARVRRASTSIVNVQGDEPFVSGAALAGAVRAACADGRFELGTAAARAPLDVLATPHVVKVVCCRRRPRDVFFAGADPVPARRGRPRRAATGTVRQHIGVYAYTPRGAAAAGWRCRRTRSSGSSGSSSCGRSPRACAMGVAIDRRGAAAAGIDTEDDLDTREPRMDSPSART